MTYNIILVSSVKHSDIFMCYIILYILYKMITTVSLGLSLYKVITILLIIFLMLYCYSPLTYFVTGSLFLFPLATTCLFHVSMTLFLFCYVCSVFFLIPHISTVFIFYILAIVNSAVMNIGVRISF